MVITFTQDELSHDANRLQDQLIKAGIRPSLVQSFADRTEITIGDDEEDAARAVFADYQPPGDEPPTPSATDVIVALASMRLENVTTVAGLKQAILPIRDAAAAVIGAESPEAG